ncbi:MAG: hypothetical protein HYV09_15665 [Deltaproteobacteria bacterium]|nr:hypothetical protein [Deltaproteobacteria bacterium]
MLVGASGLPAPRASADAIDIQVHKPRASLGVRARPLAGAGEFDLCAHGSERCVVAVAPGPYRIEVIGDRFVPGAVADMRLARPGTLDVAAGSKSLRDLGTASWIGGLVLAGLGIIGLSFAATSGSSARSTGPGIILGVGVGFTLTGLILVDQGKTTIAFR